MAAPPSFRAGGNAAATNAGTVTPVSSSTVAVSAGDVVLVWVYCATKDGTSAPAVTGVTGAGLTFARRTRSHGSTQGSLELWWATAASAIAAFQPTVSIGGAYDDCSVLFETVGGCILPNPWAASGAGVPGTYSTNSLGTPSFTYSVPYAGALLLMAFGDNVNGTGQSGPAGWGSGQGTQNPGGQNYSDLAVSSHQIATPVTNQTAAWGGPIGGKNAGEAIFDVLVSSQLVSAAGRARVLML